MTNITEMSTDGNLRLIISVVLQACIDADSEWLASDRCKYFLDLIPDEVLKRSLGVNASKMASSELSAVLVRRTRDGVFRNFYNRQLEI